MNTFVVGTKKGIVFEWGDLHFVMPVETAERLMTMLEYFEQDVEDDFITELWLGKGIFRWRTYRIPYVFEMFYPNLQAALGRHEEQRRTEYDIRTVDDAMKSIITDLDLN